MFGLGRGRRAGQYDNRFHLDFRKSSVFETVRQFTVAFYVKMGHTWQMNMDKDFS